jgi:hypothetical protein
MKRYILLIRICLPTLLVMVYFGCSNGSKSTNAEMAGSEMSSGSTIKTNDPYNIPSSVAYSGWMSSIPVVEKATLSALTLPGTHDAGAYGNSLKEIVAPTEDGQKAVDAGCDNISGWFKDKKAEYAAIFTRRKGRDFGRTQHLSVIEQLRSGIRYLDIRVVYSVDDFYIHHGLLGNRITDVLEDISNFMSHEAGPKEVVILGFSMFRENNLPYQLNIQENDDDSNKNVFVDRRVCGKKIYRYREEDDPNDPNKKIEVLYMSTPHHEQLIGMIEQQLGPFLLRKSGNNNDLRNIRIGDIVQNGPMIVVSYPKEGDYNYPDFLWSVAIHTNWANTDTLTGLQESQQTFIDGHVNSGDNRLLELQWTRTAQKEVVEKSTKCDMWGYFNCDKDIIHGYNLAICPFLPDCESHPYDSTHDLSMVTNPELGNFIYKPDQAKINIMRVDFFNESPVVDIALDYPVAVCTNVTVTANDVCMADALVDDGSTDNEGEVILTQAPLGPYPLGKTLVKLTASDGQLRSMCSATATVVDKTGPVIKTLKATPDSLWPPNHKMVPISIQVIAADNCDPKPVCRIAEVQSNEPVGQGAGTGNFEPDWVINGDLGLELRAERSGNNDGRRYDVSLECADKFNNYTRGTVSMEVPHSKSE